MRRSNRSVQYLEPIRTVTGLYAVCVGHKSDDVTSPVYPHRRGLDNGLPMLGWAPRYNRELKADEWYCPDCAKDLAPMEDEHE